MKREGVVLILFFSLFSGQVAAYKIKEFKPKPVAELPARQDFQKIAIGALPLLTEARVREVFDTKKLLERHIMPVVVVIENHNDFAIGIDERDIFLVYPEEEPVPCIPFDVVLLRISLKKPLATYSTRKEILIRQVGDKNMVLDFEHKSFGEKLIAPHESDYGVVFFPLPVNADLSGTRLYFPRVHNVTNDEPLMFFEFELGKAKE